MVRPNVLRLFGWCFGGTYWVGMTIESTFRSVRFVSARRIEHGDLHTSSVQNRTNVILTF